jgi:hypothetical protein
LVRISKAHNGGILSAGAMRLNTVYAVTQWQREMDQLRSAGPVHPD